MKYEERRGENEQGKPLLWGLRCDISSLETPPESDRMKRCVCSNGKTDMLWPLWHGIGMMGCGWMEKRCPKRAHDESNMEKRRKYEMKVSLGNEMWQLRIFPSEKGILNTWISINTVDFSLFPTPQNPAYALSSKPGPTDKRLWFCQITFPATNYSPRFQGMAKLKGFVWISYGQKWCCKEAKPNCE